MNMIMRFDTPSQAMEWAAIISKSKFCPKEFINRPEDVIVAIAYGAELGMKPLQALQNIAVINGKPSIYGDAMLAVCKNSPEFEYIKESFNEQESFATCLVKRKDQPEVSVTFSRAMAEVAGLWNRPGPWKQYPYRMLQMRARSFALRDCFPDVIKGLIVAEEAQDYSAINGQQEVSVTIEQQQSKEDLYGKLKGLIYEKNVADDTIESWREKAHVFHLKDLPLDRMQKLITHLESMERRNGV